jgi:hypothetical protein
VNAGIDIAKNRLGVQSGEGKRIRYSYQGSNGMLLVRVPVYATDWSFLVQRHSAQGLVSRVLLIFDDNEEGCEVRGPQDLNDGDTIFVTFSA